MTDYTPWHTVRTAVGGENSNCIAIFAGETTSEASLVAFVTPKSNCIPHCSVCHGLSIHPESDANAELIASAPRLKQERDDLARIFSAVIDLGIIDCDAPCHQSKQLVLLLDHAAELIERIDRE